MIRRATIENDGGLIILHNAYPGSEFLTSEDRLLRSVAIANGRMARSTSATCTTASSRNFSGRARARISARASSSTSSTRSRATDGSGGCAMTAARGAGDHTNPGQAAIAAIQLDFTVPASTASPRRTRHEISPIRTDGGETFSQELLILKQDKSVVPALQQMARSSDNLLARFHAPVDAGGVGCSRRHARACGYEGPEPPSAGAGDPRERDPLQREETSTFADDYRAATSKKTSDPTSLFKRC